MRRCHRLLLGALLIVALAALSGSRAGHGLAAPAQTRPVASAWTLTLDASKTSAAANETVLLRATSSQDVTPTPYYIRIYDSTSSVSEIRICSTGTVCDVGVAGVGETRYFFAEVTNLDRTATQATSQTVTVTWAGGCQNGMRANITSPTGGTLSTGTPTFQWAGGVCVTQYYLYVGSGPGQNDYYNSGQLAGTVSQATVSPAIPVDGRTIYVRLWSLVSGAYQLMDRGYVMGTCNNPLKADITAPAGGSISTGSPTFQWGGGACVTQYYLYVGSSYGQGDLFAAGPLPGTSTQATVSPAIPVDGRAIFVRLWSFVGGGWQLVEHSYLMGSCQNPSKADITSPTPGTTLGTSHVFQWAGGSCVTQYYFFIGSTYGTSDLYASGPLAGNVVSQSVSSLPTNGSTAYLRLWSFVNGSWQLVEHSYLTSSSASRPLPAQH